MEKSLMTALNDIKQKRSTGIISKILGRDKFIRLNLQMLKKLGPNAACFLTYLLDKADFLELSNQISSVEEEGLYLYRSDITDKVGISPYTQRQIEKNLQGLGIIKVVEQKLKDNQTRNRYFVDLLVLDGFLDK